MGKRTHQYKLTLEYLKDNQGKETDLPALELLFENHDDLFHIIEITRIKNLFNSENQSIEFIVGLKLFSEIVLRHKNHPLFEEIKPAMGIMMKKLKAI